MNNLKNLENICIKTLENLDKNKGKEEDKEKYKKYIEVLIRNKFTLILRKIAIEAIYTSHKYVRERNGISSVSLRDLQRFTRAYKFFK